MKVSPTGLLTYEIYWIFQLNCKICLSQCVWKIALKIFALNQIEMDTVICKQTIQHNTNIYIYFLWHAHKVKQIFAPKDQVTTSKCEKKKMNFSQINIEYFTVSEVNDKLPANPQANNNKICIRLFGGM